jgi:MFS family permease
MGTFERAAAFQTFSAVVAFLVLSRVREEFTPHPRAPRSMRSVMRGSLLGAGLSVGFVNVHYPVIAGFLILHLAKYGGAGPAAFSAYAGTVLFSRFFLGSLPDRIHPAITFYTGALAMAVGLLLLASGPSEWLAIAAAGLLGFGFSFPWSSVASVVMRRTPPGERGSTVSVLSAFYDIFVGASSLAAGAVADRFGYPAAFRMAAVALIFGAIAARWVFWRDVND